MSEPHHAIHKYRVPPADEFELEMPIGARILTVQVQHNQPQLWAMVDTETQLKERRHFACYGTGHPVDERLAQVGSIYSRHIGTFQLEDGDLVFHLFERGS